jgi:ABC-type proline/glycine betaine transport system ATPase subunit
MVEGLLIADRVGVMNEGELVQIGSPHELLTSPATPYVEQLLETPRRQARIVSSLEARPRDSST